MEPTHKLVNGVRVPLSGEEKEVALVEWEKNAAKAANERKPTLEERVAALEKRGA